MRLVWLILGLSSLSCAARASGPRFVASQVTELQAPPPGYVEGERISASCALGAPSDPIESRELIDIDCSFERLSRVLRAQAGERSSPALVAKECRQVTFSVPSLACSATLVARTSSVSLGPSLAPSDARPAPSPAQVLDLDDPRPQDSGKIRVSFAPSGAPSPLPARAYDRVAETTWPPVGRRTLGQVSARCEGCSEESLRYALRVTAGRVGAGEVSGVKCFDDAADKRCVATAFVPWSS